MLPSLCIIGAMKQEFNDLLNEGGWKQISHLPLYFQGYVKKRKKCHVYLFFYDVPPDKDVGVGLQLFFYLTMRVIEYLSPTCVINMGTAGVFLKENLNISFMVFRVYRALTMSSHFRPFYSTSSDSVDMADCLSMKSVSLLSSDIFQPSIEELRFCVRQSIQLKDMECYAVARACFLNEVPFYSIKHGIDNVYLANDHVFYSYMHLIKQASLTLKNDVNNFLMVWEDCL